MRIPLSLALFLAVLAGGFGSGPHAAGRWDDGTATRPGNDSLSQPPDSVHLLMFAGYKVRRLEAVSASGWIANGAPLTEDRITIEVEDEAITLNGRSVKECALRPARGGAITLTIPGRSKNIRGRFHCSPRNGRLLIVATLPLRDYLAATLTSEASPADPPEYLAALSVLQRNYLLFHRGRHAPDADLCDNTHCQLAEAKNGSPRIYAAVQNALGLELAAGETGHPCYYSVNCGGSTLSPAQIWNHPEPGYTNVKCSHCRGSARYRWERTIPATQEAEALLRGAPVPPFVDDDFKIRLGRAVGFNKVLSNTIDRIERRGRSYLIAGRGFGHRVGLCQEGARQLALHRWKAAEILRFYFPAARVSLRP